MELAEAQVAASQFSDASASIEEALTASQGMPGWVNPTQYHGRAAIIHASMGDYERVASLIRSVDRNMYPPGYWMQAAKAAVRAEGAAAAAGLAAYAESQVDHIHILIGAAEALAGD